MFEVRIRPRARRDLSGIWTYTRRRWSVEQANRYLTSIHSEIARLRQNPKLGRPVQNAQAPFLKRACGKHVIFYLIDADALDVVRVLHESMDFSTHLANDET